MRQLRRLACAACLLAANSFGYIRLVYTDASGSVPYRRSDSAGIAFFLNNEIRPGQVSNASGANVTVMARDSDPVSAVRFALARWNSLAAGRVKFLPLQPTDATHNSADSRAVITFASADDLSVMGFSPGRSVGAIGLTVSTIAIETGRLANGNSVTRGDIIDSDILLNSSLTFSTDGSTPYDVQAVVTHELGHALGQNHNGLLGSTMFPYSTAGPIPVLSQRLLGSDDDSFLNAAYGPGAGAFGTIAGSVALSDGSAVKAGLITLIDAADGNSIGAITESDGTYSVQVPAGSYAIYAEPMTAASVVQAWNIIGLDATQVSSGFQPGMLGGTVTITAGATVNAPLLTVASGPGALSLPQIGFGAAGGSGDIRTVNTVNGPRTLASGQPVDIGLVGGGLDGSEAILVLGQGISVRAGSVRVDKSERFSSFPGSPLVRATLDIPARQNTTLASVFISKATGAIALSGFVVLTPPAPVFTAAGVDSAAGAQWLGGVSPGGITAIYDVPNMPNLGPENAAVNAGYDAYGKLPGTLAGVSVTFDGVPAPLFFVAAGQINLQVPFEVAGKTSTNVVVGYEGSFSAPVTVPVVAAQPAFFMLNATDPYAANSDYATTPKPNSAANPAARGTVISVYGTGVGNLYPVATGTGAPAPPASYVTHYTCALGSRSIAVPFAGWSPTTVGLAQWSFVIPNDSPTGAVSLKCTDGASGSSTQAATIYIR